MNDLMKFTTTKKVKCSAGYISETDLLTASKRSIRARQRKITNVQPSVWINKSNYGEKYSKALLYFNQIFQN